MNRELLRQISQAKLRILLELMEESKGKGPDSMMTLLLQANQKMQQQGLQFTSDESKLVLDMLKETMSPAEVQRIEMMQSMLANLQR